MVEEQSKQRINILSIWKRVVALMTAKERRQAVLLMGGVFINSMADILGLAAVVPVIGLVINPELIAENQYLNQFFVLTSHVGVDTERRFLMLCSVLLVAAFLLKALINLTLGLLQTRYSLGIGHRLSGLMWQFHFSQSLERLRSKQSGRVLTEINGWPNVVANVFIVANLALLNDFVVIGLICAGLLVYNPVVMLSIAAMLLAGSIIIQRITRRRLTDYSHMRLIVGPEVATLINSAVRGFLEVITFQSSDAIRTSYLKKTKLLIRIQSNSKIMKMAPAKLYEVLAIVAVSGAIFISLLLHQTNESFLNLLIFMALSAYRIMPSMSRINGQLMNMRGNMHVFETIEKSIMDWRALQKTAQVSDNTEQLNGINLEIKDLTVGYASLSDPVFKNLNAKFDSGQVNAIVGASGSGKSTLVNTILGLHAPESGAILIEDGGQKLPRAERLDLAHWLKHIGYLSQRPFLFNSSVRDNLTMGSKSAAIDEAEVDALIAALELEDCLGQNPLEFELYEGGNNLSGGQQQRLAILRALRVFRPLLILDEATSALDGPKRDAVFHLLQQRAKRGCNVLLITHDTELANMCDSVLDLNALQTEK